MAPKKQMSVSKKVEINVLYKQGVSIREISRKLGYNESSIRRFIKKFQETGSVHRKRGTGRNRKTSRADDRLLKFRCLANRFSSAPELKAELANTTYDNVGIRTVERRLKEFGFMSRRPAKKPALKKEMKQKRLSWALQHRNWSLDDWAKVIFSDESKFNVFGQDGRTNVRRRKGERFNEDCVLPTVKHSPYVMFWGCITIHGVGRLEIVDGMVNTEKYKNIIRNCLLPTIEDLTQYTSDPLFQDDSAPCHRARGVHDLKEELGIRSLSWPANSPDLNPIENLWSNLSRKLKNQKPQTRGDLINKVNFIWENEITQEDIRNLYESMPRRIEAVIMAKGAATKY